MYKENHLAEVKSYRDGFKHQLLKDLAPGFPSRAYSQRTTWTEACQEISEGSLILEVAFSVNCLKHHLQDYHIKSGLSTYLGMEVVGDARPHSFKTCVMSLQAQRSW